MKNTSGGKLLWIEALRGYGALAVMACHLIQQLNKSFILYPAPGIEYLLNGAHAVQLFFMLTGLTMFISLDKGISGYTNYLRKRYIRIFVPYIIAIAVYWCIGKGYSLLSTSTGSLKISLGGILLNALGLNGFSIRYVNSVVPGGWYIGVIWLYYLIAPFLFQWVNSISKSIKCILVGLLLRVGTHFISATMIADPMVANWAGMLFTNHFVFIAIGQYLYYALVKKDNIVGVGDHLILMAILLYISLLKDSLMFWAFIIVGILLVMALYNKNNLLINRFSLFIGKFSMQIYLFHMVAIYYVCQIPSLNFNNPYVTIVVTYGLSLFITLTLALLVDKVIYYGSMLRIHMKSRK